MMFLVQARATKLEFIRDSMLLRRNWRKRDYIRLDFVRTIRGTQWTRL